MDVDQMMIDSLKYPMSSWGKVVTLGAIPFLTMIILIIGIIAAVFVNNVIFTVLVVILEIVIAILAAALFQGYLYKVLKSSLKGKDKLPKFKKFPKLMVNGLKVMVVSLAYGIVFCIIIGILFAVAFFIGVLPGGVYSTSYMYSLSSSPNLLLFWLYYLVYYIFLLANVVLSILLSIIVSIAVANMASKGKFKAAFNLSDIREKIENIRWGKAVVWVFAINFITLVVMLLGFVSLMLVIGFILLPLLIVPYLSIFEYRAIALLYKSA